MKIILMKSSKCYMTRYLALFCLLLAAFSGSASANGEAASYELIHFIKKDVQFNEREDSWGGIARMTGRWELDAQNDFLTTLGETVIIAEYGEGMMEGLDATIKQSCCGMGSTSGS